jgi:plastocyanin
MKNYFDTLTAIRRMLIVSLFLIALLVSGFGISCQPQGSTPQQTEVVIEGLAFNPAEINVPVGSTVTWSNEDSVTHTVTARDNTFDSGNLPAGGTFNYTFEEKGTFEYYCTLHPNMEGKVVVE